jgi:hypothetical protein
MNAPADDAHAYLTARLRDITQARAARLARRQARAVAATPGRASAPVPAFLRHPSAEQWRAAAQAECQHLRARIASVTDLLPALDTARKNARQALTGGPVSLTERARIADLLDRVAGELSRALHGAPDATPPEAA